MEVLSLTTLVGNDVLLATSSQDGQIQLFKFTENSIDSSKYSVKTSRSKYNVTLETILTGHEGWVYSVHWSPSNTLKLLSSSIDKTIIIWEYDESVNYWLETTRLGEVGGNTLGFYGAEFGPDGKSIIAHSYHGAFHLWNYDETSNNWDPRVTMGGHFGEVIDVAWESSGEFLVSASYDQTTRVHAPWHCENKVVPPNKYILHFFKIIAFQVTWHEMARPQVHGYDLNSLAMLSRYKFVSCAEEKVIRAFQAPNNFIQNFKKLCDIKEDSAGNVLIITI